MIVALGEAINLNSTYNQKNHITMVMLHYQRENLLIHIKIFLRHFDLVYYYIE